MKLLLDEMLGPGIAKQLRDRGLDAIGVVKRTDLRARPDESVLDFARDEGRIVVTRNVGDFARLHQRSLAGGGRIRA